MGGLGGQTTKNRFTLELKCEKPPFQTILYAAAVKNSVIVMDKRSEISVTGIILEPAASVVTRNVGNATWDMLKLKAAAIVVTRSVVYVK